MSHEAEMPGIEIGKETMQIICFRYFFASEFVEGKEVLEIGCGPGLGLSYLSKKAKRIIGGDYAEDNLGLAQKNHVAGVELVLLDAHNLPFKDGSFDAVVAMAVFYCLDADKVLDECCRLLKKREGTLIFCMPNRNQPGFRPSSFSKNYFSASELFTMLKRHQFDAEIFAAFPIPPHARIRQILQLIKGKIATATVRILRVMPKGGVIKSFLVARTRKTRILRENIEEEIERGMIENIKPVPIYGDSPESRYKMFYVVGRPKCVKF